MDKIKWIYLDTEKGILSGNPAEIDKGNYNIDITVIDPY